MANKKIFFIEDLEVDLSRSVLIKGEQEKPIEPKVLQVLSLLAQRQNEVVTHKEIMEQVWLGAEVVPSALQRCIAILRKELGDNAKSPTIIATHPKIGYRLLAEVRWQQSDLSVGAGAKANDAEINFEKHTKTAAKDPGIKLKFSSQAISMLAISVLAITVLIVITGIFWTAPNPEQDIFPKQFSKFKPLTRTDAHESHAVYSPSANYMVFNRYAGSCKSHIWARHLESGKESRLTALPADFGGVSFTGDGRELIFAANFKCDEVNNNLDASSAPTVDDFDASFESEDSTMATDRSAKQTCWSVATLDFSLSLTSPQSPNFRHQCEADRLKTPKALANHQYVFLQYDNGRHRLMHYNDLNKEVKPFYMSKTHYIYHFDYDHKRKRFAVFSRDHNFNTLLTLLDGSAQVVRQETIKLLPQMSRYQLLRGNFEPQAEYMLAVSNNRLFKISLDGRVELVQIPTPNLISVVKHPSKNVLLAVQGKKDVDVVQLGIAEEESRQIEYDLNSVTLPFESFARSSAQERYALFQPKGDKIAFISDRSGSDQIWIWHDNIASQLSYLTHQSKIESLSWSPDGKRLAWAAGDKLVVSDLDGNIQPFKTPKPIYAVLSWYKDDQFLVVLNDPEPGGLYHLDVSQNELTQYGINQVDKAWVVHNQIVFNNANGEVFIRSIEFDKKESRKLIEQSKHIFIAGQFIYNVDEQFLLSQHDMDGQLIKPVMPLKKMAWKVSDLKDKQLLLAQFVSISNDIVMLE